MNNRTELVFILDRSGSMCGLEADTVGGFNGMLRKQRKQAGVCFVTTVLFDSHSCTLHDRLPLEQVPDMTEHDYTVGGCTALVDALGETIRHIGDIHRYARSEDVPEHTVFIITTDGMENASRRYTADKVRRMIEKKKSSGWEFLFLGANIDAVETAGRYGIGRERAVNYLADSDGTAVNYRAMNDAICQVRRGAALTEEWKSCVEADYNSRKDG